MYMDLLELFAGNYLESYDTDIVVNKIYKNKDSFFHALEYASGDSLQGEGQNTTCINLAKEDVSSFTSILINCPSCCNPSARHKAE